MRADQDNADDLNRAALAALDQRQFAQASDFIERALRAKPDSIDYLITAGRIHNNNGELQEAKRLFSKVVEIEPASADGWFFLGHVNQRLGETESAVQALSHALQLNPVNQAAHQRLGALLQQQGRFESAVAHLQEAVNLHPGDANAHYNFGLVLHELGHFDRAQHEFQKTIDLQPDDSDACSNLGAVLQSQGRFEDAVVMFQRALEINPTHQPSLAALAGIHDLRGDYQQGIDLLESGLRATTEESLPMAVALAQLLNRVGRREEIPGLLEPLLSNHPEKEPEMAPLLFTLGDYYDRVGDYDRAIELVSRANNMRRVPFDSDAHFARIKNLIDWFSGERLASLPRSGLSTMRPIFIVGMPRSGTSLVEQILSSHSQVFGAGELDAIARLAGQVANSTSGYPAALADSSANELASLAQQYLSHLEDIDTGASRITDKMWHNFEYLGFISLLFPNASVIHCMRDARDTGLSCYFQSFGVAGPPFACDLNDIADYTRAYRKLMAHWHAVLGTQILDIRYEHLVTETEQQVRKMLEYLQLEWEPECLAYDRNRRVVRTASHAQVREPIYTRSVNRYKNYVAHIDPLLGLEEEQTQ